MFKNVGRIPTEVVADPGFCGVNRDHLDMEIIHRNKHESIYQVTASMAEAMPGRAACHWLFEVEP